MSQKLNPEARTVSLTVRLPDDLMARVNLFALDTGARKAEAVRELLERGLAAPANPMPTAQQVLDGRPARQRAPTRALAEAEARAEKALKGWNERRAAPDEKCRHPVSNRYRDGQCGLCGEMVKGQK